MYFAMSALYRGKFYSGTSGLVLSEPNKKSFPVSFQEKSRLEYYASLFNSIEVNSSFYKIPQFKTCLRWAESVPGSFKFTVKIWRGITHVENFNEGDVKKFMFAVRGLKGKTGCLLIQYPARSKSTFRNLEDLLRLIHDLDPEWKPAIEIRNPGWLTDDFRSLIKSYHASLVLHDRQNAEVLNIAIHSSFVYLRYHGPTGDFRGSYSETWLKNQAIAIAGYLKSGMDVFAYFNNTMGDAVSNLKTLNRMVNDQLNNQ
jgi:uncharacterized protein YecE (DUF72 family)